MKSSRSKSRFARKLPPNVSLTRSHSNTSHWRMSRESGELKFRVALDSQCKRPELVKWIDEIFRMNVSGFGPLNWVAGKSVTNVIQETVLQVRTLQLAILDIFYYLFRLSRII